MGGLKALIQKMTHLFNTSYPDVSKRILLNWLQHNERSGNGSLQKIYSLFNYYDNLYTSFLGWDLKFCCFCDRDTGFHMCHKLQIICQIYCKKRERKSCPPTQPAQRKLCWYKIAILPSPSALSPSMQGEAHLLCLGLPTALLSQKERKSFSLQGKPLAARTQDKGETRTKPPPVLSPTPHDHCYLPNSGPPSGGEWGQCWEKLLSPRRTYWAHFRVCKPQVLQLFLIFPLWEAAQHLQPALGTGRKLLKGGVPTFAELWTIRIKSWVELQGSWDRADFEQSAGMNIPVLSQDGQSLLEQDSVYLQQSTGCAEIVTEKCYAVFWFLNLFLHVL